MNDMGTETLEQDKRAEFLSECLNSDAVSGEYGVIHRLRQGVAIAYFKYTEDDEVLQRAEEKDFVERIEEMEVEVLAELCLQVGKRDGRREYVKGVMFEFNRYIGSFALPFLVYVKSEYGPRKYLLGSE